MRDKCDLFTLVSEKALAGLKAPLDREWTESVRKKYKLADVRPLSPPLRSPSEYLVLTLRRSRPFARLQRQFYRLVEMLLLLSSDPNDAAQQRLIRLGVKKRLYLFNKEQLLQIEDKEERKAKLQETFIGVQDDYRRLTDKFSAA